MKKNNMIKSIGMSYERSPGSISKWRKFFDILDVECIVSKLQPEQAVQKAERVFKYSTDYCFFRKSCLGQYIDLIEKGCRNLVIPVKIKDGFLACNSSKFMAIELAEYYRNQIHIFNANIYTSDKKMIDIKKIAEYFCDSPETIKKALNIWKEKESKRKNVFLEKNSSKKKDITILLVGKINHFFDYTDLNSPFVCYLVERIGVKVIDPENLQKANLNMVKKAYQLLNGANLFIKNNREAYWPELNIIAAVMAHKEELDGVIFVRDCYCNAGIEEINILQNIMNIMKIPNIIVNFNLEAQSSIETILETFVEMIEWSKG